MHVPVTGFRCTAGRYQVLSLKIRREGGCIIPDLSLAHYESQGRALFFFFFAFFFWPLRFGGLAASHILSIALSPMLRDDLEWQAC